MYKRQTYSFERLYQDGGFTRFDAIDKTKEYGCQGVELVLDDKTPDGSTPMEYAKALYAHAKEQGLEVPIYTTGANFFVKEPEKELERLCRHIDIAAECKIPLLRHDVAWGYYEGYTGIKSYKKVIEAVAPFVRQAAEYARERGVKTCSENHGYLLQDSARMLELFAAVDHPNYGFLCDMGNFTVVDEDCATAVSALSDYIVHVHAKDMLVLSLIHI